MIYEVEGRTEGKFVEVGEHQWVGAGGAVGGVVVRGGASATGVGTGAGTAAGCAAVIVTVVNTATATPAPACVPFEIPYPLFQPVPSVLQVSGVVIHSGGEHSGTEPNGSLVG